MSGQGPVGALGRRVRLGGKGHEVERIVQGGCTLSQPVGSNSFSCAETAPMNEYSSAPNRAQADNNRNHVRMCKCFSVDGSGGELIKYKVFNRDFNRVLGRGVA